MKNLFSSVIITFFLICQVNGQDLKRGLPIKITTCTIDHSITWANLDNAVVTVGNTLTTSAGSWGNGASSSEVLSIGDAGYIELSVTNDPCGCFRMFGLGTTNTGNSYTRINFAIYLEPNGAGGGDIHYSESGSISGSIGTYSASDIIRVRKSSAGVITYEKNLSVLQTSGTTASTPLYANAAAFNAAVVIENLTLSSCFH